MNKNILYIVISISGLFFQGCASIIYLKGAEPKIETNEKPISVCANKVKIMWTDEAFGTVSNKTYENSSDTLIQKQKLMLSEQIHQNFNDRNCDSSSKALIEIRNAPVDQKRLLALLNIVSIGIIPYYDEYNNFVEIKFYDQDGNMKGRVSSSYKYEMIHSIFLWPAMFFYINGTNELNLKMIPLHFNNISEKIHKNEGLK